ncbi:MAG: hypothetical protein HOF77_05635, partial [Actinobacteria bacterium]|nr:hypothetical protein [Actinomycetota bacterium]
MGKLDKSDVLNDLLNFIQKTTSKPEEESLTILQKFTTEIEKKLSQNSSELSEIFTSLDKVTHNQPIYLSNIPFTSL